VVSVYNVDVLGENGFVTPATHAHSRTQHRTRTMHSQGS